MTIKHMIHSLEFEIEGFENNSHFQTFASKISSIVRTTLKNMLDILLSEYDIEGYHITIDKLEIDLGFINNHNLTNDLSRQLKTELRKYLKRLNSQSKYEIKHNKLDSESTLKLRDRNFRNIIARKQLNTTYEINKDPSHYFPSKIHHKVIPEDARYVDAVIHYLEYGWLPRYLDIPMLEFDDIFVETLTTYGEDIKNYFGRKPKSQISKITERILRQTKKKTSISISKKTAEAVTKIALGEKVNKETSSALKKIILGSPSNEKVSTFLKIIDLIQTGSKPTFSEEEKKEFVKLTEQIKEQNVFVDKITGINSSSFNPFEKIDLRIEEMLDSRDRTFFNSLLKTPFYKSLVTSYLPKSDSKAILIRTLLPILIEPGQTEEYLKYSTELVDTENELINQLYGKSPLAIKEIFKQISAYRTPEQIAKNITTFIDKLSKKQTNNLLKTFFSYYNTLSVELNQINEIIEKISYSNLLSYVSSLILGANYNFQSKPSSSNTYAHTQLLILIAISNKPIDEILKKYREAVKSYLIKEKIIKSTDKLKLFRANSKVKEREYLEFTDADNLIIETYKQEQKILELDNIDISIYRLKTLLQDYYLPIKLRKKLDYIKIDESKEKLGSSEKSILEKSDLKTVKTNIDDQSTENNDIKPSERRQKIDLQNEKNLTDGSKQVNKETQSEMIKFDSNLSSLIKQLKEQKVSKKEIQELFSNKRILKNQVLAKLTPITFKEILELALSTDKARLFQKLYEKYQQFFRIHVNNEQVQLIFLSLINSHNILTEENIFKLYYEELKKLKGWTYDVHKKNLIHMYESKSENFSEDEKKQIIKYIDEIPTYLGLELKDTKKKLEEGIPIKNAGLCLLWPFFKTLFSISGYLDPKGEFKNVEMRERATLLLQYLAVKSTSIEEPYLALNKIFTGLPLEESLPKEIVLTEKERDIADALLLNVIKQWPSFENSSPDNLRGSFIIRDGVLFFRGKQWVLRVENKAYDLLLGKLPWGYSMIRLSWIPYMIKVEWN